MGITGPGEADWPDSLAAIYDEFKALIGPEAATRFERYVGLADPPRPATPNYTVGAIGVAPEYQGRGVGRLLLDDIHARSAAHPTSQGVYLDTENPASKRFYERCGYRAIAHERLDGVIDIWGMYRADPGVEEGGNDESDEQQVRRGG